MPRTTVAVFFACAVLYGGSPPGLAPPPPSGLSITGTDVEDARSDSAEITILVLPGAREVPVRKVEPQPIPLKTAPRSAAPLPSLPEPPAVAPLTVALLRKSPPPPAVSRPFNAPAPAARPKMPDDFERDGALFLQRRLGVWHEEDARRLFGSPARDRVAFDADKKPDGRILAFSDPTRRYREFELDFDGASGYLRTVFVYPWKMKWDDCRRLWGNNVISTQAANGRSFHSYENRRLDVLVDGSGTVVSLGLY